MRARRAGTADSPDGSLKAEPMGHQPKWPSAPLYFFRRWWHLFERAGLSHADPHADARGALNDVRILRPDTVALMGQNQIGRIDVGVLHTTVPTVSNDVDFFPGIKLKLGFGHLITTELVPGGRSAGSPTWAGIYNTYYWIDAKKRIAAVFMTQVLPFADVRCPVLTSPCRQQTLLRVRARRALDIRHDHRYR